jgi:hypothetical protein
VKLLKRRERFDRIIVGVFKLTPSSLLASPSLED